MDEIDDDYPVMPKEDSRAKKVQKWFVTARDARKDWRNEADEMFAMYAGHQWTDEEKAEFEEEGRPEIVFNRVGPNVDAVTGHQVSNRQEIKYFPREAGDAQQSEIVTGASQWADDECDAEQEVSCAFEDMLVCGEGWCETRMSYDEDPDGQIITAEHIDPREIYPDPTSTKKNYSDAKYIIRARWFDREEAEARWPELENVFPSDGPVDIFAQDNGVHVTDPRNFYDDDSNSSFYDAHKDQVLIFQCQYYTLENIYRVGDVQSQRVIELSEAKFKRLKDRIELMGSKYVKQTRKVWKQTFTAGNFLLEGGDAPCKYQPSLIAMTGKRDRKKKCWYGLVRGMRDPQKWSNKFFADIQDILVSNRQGGAFVEETALVDVRAAEQAWNESNPLIFVRDGALARGQIQERNPIPYPNGLDRLMMFAVSSIPDVSGINMELLGLVDRTQPGVVESGRKRQSLGILQKFFDALKKFQRQRGRVVLHFIQEHISDGRLIRINGQDGMQQNVPLLRDYTLGKYDLIVDESPSSPNKKEETFLIMRELGPWMAQFGISPPADIVDYLPIPLSLASKWKQQMMPQQPSPEQQLAMANMEAEVRNKVAKEEETKSKVALNYAKAQDIADSGEINQFKVISDAIGDERRTAATERISMANNQKQQRNQ